MEHLEDRLSELPVSLILLILSFLPMREVVFTTFLSKHWRNLWTSVPSLNFTNLSRDAERVRNFVNSALSLWKGNKILRFKFEFRAHFDMSLAGDIDSWVRFAVKHNVEELTVYLVYDRDNLAWIEDSINRTKRDVYTVPQCLYLCSSLRKLMLMGCNLGMDVSPLWYNLESLILHGFCFSECLINRIVSCSPRLEFFDLSLLESFEDLSIRSLSLKRLKIGKFLYGGFDDASLDNVLSICCPNLETLELTRIPYWKCLFTDVSSVTNCALGFHNLNYDLIHLDITEKELLGETIMQILPAILRVEKLVLSISSVEVWFLFQYLRTSCMIINARAFSYSNTYCLKIYLVFI